MSALSRARIVAVAVAACLTAGVSSAQDEPTIGTGAQYENAVLYAVELARRGRSERALETVQPALEFCGRQLARPGIRAVSVRNVEEYRRFVSDNPGVRAEWFDLACAAAYTLVGFVHAGEKRLEAALPPLEQAIAIAPYNPDPLNEAGYVLNQMGRHAEATLMYQRVLDLAERHPPATHARGRAMRGIGWALIETGDLDGAQRMYEASLVAEPRNETALSELAYIQRARAAAKSAPGQ